ncbi:MAG: hypothetical protein O3B86_12790, partial [Planctomycetota bacterium]|nr:hypothetical protein [Planctomycetota bacterium]
MSGTQHGVPNKGNRSAPIRSSMQTFLFPSALFLLATAVAQADDTLAIPESVTGILAQRCVDCHSGDSPEGDVRLDT